VLRRPDSLALSSLRKEGGEHPRTLGWVATSALAMGGSNQSLFLIGALIVSQGSAAVPLLVVGLILSWMAMPGWIELIMMWPNRVGGIAATCAEAFRPYSPVLANLTGVCYWWGWVPTCGLTALLSAAALHAWYLPWMPVTWLACLIVLAFTAVNLCGVRWVGRLAIPIATASAALAFLSALIPLLSGNVDWERASHFSLLTPFHGVFGQVTSAMAGLYLIGFAAPAFEAAACHVGETKDPTKNVPRAMFVSAGMASLYFLVLPIVWLGALGTGPIAGELAHTLGPTFAPLFGGLAQSAAIWFMVFNMFHGTLQPLAGAARTLMQLAEDGLLPRILGWRLARTDAPWVATLLTAGMSILFLLAGDPIWMLAAANLTYLIGICLPSIAVWLLRRNEPDRERPWRAPRFTIGLGVAAACAWGVSTVLGFEQFGLPTVLAGLGLAYAGSALYAVRVWRDGRGQPRRSPLRSLHVKLTGAMLAVLVLDGIGYLLAVSRVDRGHNMLVVALSDIFVAVALLTISVGLILPGLISHAVGEVGEAAERLARGTLADLNRAISALGAGDLDSVHPAPAVKEVVVRSRDEIGLMADNFNIMQREIGRSSVALDNARQRLRDANDERARLEVEVRQSQKMDAVGQLAGGVAHDFNNILTAIIGYADIAVMRNKGGEEIAEIRRAADRAANLTQQLLAFSRRQMVQPKPVDLNEVVVATARMLERLIGDNVKLTLDLHDGPVVTEIDAGQLDQILVNLAVNGRDAMPSGGDLVLSTRVDGDSVQLGVRDTGLGMDAETRLKIFDPFFTTKEPGRGTGLGLSTVYGIVQQAGGLIDVDSTPGHGTTFHILLPRTDRVPEVTAFEPEDHPTGVETILLVEDEDVVRGLVEKSLKAFGYRVISAAAPHEALAAAELHDFDLLVTDVVMPEMNGRELAELLAETRPGLRVLYTSGYASHVLLEDGVLSEATSFLQKPFALDDLARKVRDVLDADELAPV
jgi:signal transduction histidine kinase/ActR/RegA family two-component response regulator